MKPAIFRLFDLHHDQDDPDAIDATIRDAMRLGGTNLWVLIFAILLASIGLNVNSPAVIIGAMLISPLMGPIIGIGYGAGINDFSLIRTGLRNLGVFVAISLLASTLYFLVSPLALAHSELLARTSPTLWDVLVAFFGGSAGIVAATRRHKSPVIPGVAIATALMPPLCTAGYGLATGNLGFFLGAFYLFSINGVFIALSTLLFVKLLKLPQYTYIDDATRRRARLVIFATVAATALPSAYLAYRLVQNELFYVAANRMLEEFEQNRQLALLGKDIDPAGRTVTVTLAGGSLPPGLEERLAARLEGSGFRDARIQLRHPGSPAMDVATLKTELQQDLYRNTLQQLEQVSAQAKALETENRRLREERAGQDQLIREIQAQYPELARVAVALGNGEKGDGKDLAGLMVVATSARPLKTIDRDRIAAWLKVRFPGRQVQVVLDPPPAPTVRREAPPVIKPARRRVSRNLDIGNGMPG